MHVNGMAVRYEPIDYAKRVGKSSIRPIRDTFNFFSLVLRTIMYFRVMAANLVAARNTDREGIALGVYSKAVADYRRVHPTATNLELLLLDFHFLKKDYKKVLKINVSTR